MLITNMFSYSNVCVMPTERLLYRKKLCYVSLISFVLVMCLADPVFAVTVQSLVEPTKDFKKEIFGGWLGVVKVGAFAGGLVMSVFRFTVAPVLTGIGVTTGIVLFDKYLGDGSAGALI